MKISFMITVIFYTSKLRLIVNECKSLNPPGTHFVSQLGMFDTGVAEDNVVVSSDASGTFSNFCSRMHCSNVPVTMDTCKVDGLCLIIPRQCSSHKSKLNANATMFTPPPFE